MSLKACEHEDDDWPRSRLFILGSGSIPRRSCVSSTTVEDVTDEGANWPFGSTDKSITSSGFESSEDDSMNNSGLLGNACSVNGEEIDSLNFMDERGLVQRL